MDFKEFLNKKKEEESSKDSNEKDNHEKKVRFSSLCPVCKHAKDHCTCNKSDEK